MTAGRCKYVVGCLISLVALAAYGEIGLWVKYTGLDRAHLKIEIPYSGFHTATEIRPDRSTNILWQGSGPVSLDVFRENLAPGSYSYWLDYQYDSGGFQTPAAFKGVPLRDEIYEDVSITSPLQEPGQLTIPSGRSIGLNRVTLPTNSQVSVAGNGAFTVAASQMGALTVQGDGDFTFTENVFLVRSPRSAISPEPSF